MGFPVLSYSDEFLPNIFLHALSLLTLLTNLISSLFHFLGLSSSSIQIQPPDSDYIYNADIPLLFPHAPPPFQLPRAVKFESLTEPRPESCAVCLHEFETGEEVRWLSNCSHVFHCGCLDRWMGFDQTTCPLCRAQFLPDHGADGTTRED